MGDFWDDFTIKDALSVYSGIEKQKAAVEIAEIENSGNQQRQTLHAPTSVNADEAIGSGNAVVPGAKEPSYWERIPKPLLYGSIVVLTLATAKALR